MPGHNQDGDPPPGTPSPGGGIPTIKLADVWIVIATEEGGQIQVGSGLGKVVFYEDHRDAMAMARRLRFGNPEGMEFWAIRPLSAELG